MCFANRNGRLRIAVDVAAMRFATDAATPVDAMLRNCCDAPARTALASIG
jgi:hypothetical protein